MNKRFFGAWENQNKLPLRNFTSQQSWLIRLWAHNPGEKYNFSWRNEKIKKCQLKWRPTQTTTFQRRTIWTTTKKRWKRRNKSQRWCRSKENMCMENPIAAGTPFTTQQCTSNLPMFESINQRIAWNQSARSMLSTWSVWSKDSPKRMSANTCPSTRATMPPGSPRSSAKRFDFTSNCSILIDIDSLCAWMSWKSITKRFARKSVSCGTMQTIVGHISGTKRKHLLLLSPYLGFIGINMHRAVNKRNSHKRFSAFVRSIKQIDVASFRQFFSAENENKNHFPSFFAAHTTPARKIPTLRHVDRYVIVSWKKAVKCLIYKMLSPFDSLTPDHKLPTQILTDEKTARSRHCRLAVKISSYCSTHSHIGCNTVTVTTPAHRTSASISSAA